MTSDNLNLFQHRMFMRFQLARFLGVASNQMLMIALAWHMYALTDSAWQLGLVGLVQFVPALVFTLPAGQVADRFHRGKIFALCMFTQAVVATAMYFSVVAQFASGDLILFLSIFLGMNRAFLMPVQQAMTPLLVPSYLLARAVAFGSSGLQLAIILGPAVGGLLYALGADVVYATCALMLLVSFVAGLSIRYQHDPKRLSMSWSSMLAGVVFVWNNKLLLGASSLDLFAVLLGGATALLPIYAKDILHIGPEGLGVLRAAPAVGALLMAVVLTRSPMERRVGARLLWAVATFGIAMIVFGLSRNFWLSLVALFVSGAADNVSMVIRLTLMQMETPDDMRGRVSAVNGVFIGASNQLGEFESGSVAALLGPIFSVVSGGVGTIVIVLLWRRWFPQLAQRNTLSP